MSKQETNYKYLGNGRYEVTTTISDEIGYLDILQKKETAEEYLSRYGDDEKIGANVKAILESNKAMFVRNCEIAKADLEGFNSLDLKRAEADLKAYQKGIMKENSKE